MNNCLIIADDFTGANDTGIELKKRGIETHVILNGRQAVDAHVSYVIDTETRNMEGVSAYKQIKRHINDISFDKFKLIYKKTDSTLRGNIGWESKAIDEKYGAELIIFVPAFPTIDRTTVEGVHYVNGRRILQSEFAKDPKKPVMEDNIRNIMEVSFEEKVTHHSLNKVQKKEIEFSKGRIHTFDVLTNTDLMTIARCGIDTEKRILWIGSAGMVDAILNIKEAAKPVLAIAGSLSEVTRIQLKYAKENGISILNVDISKLLKDLNIDYYKKVASDIISDGRDLIITTAYKEQDYWNAIKIGEKNCLSREEVSDYAKNILGEIGRSIVKQVDVSGVFITGGDVAIGFIEKVGAKGSIIQEEVMTGIPLMTINGGEFHGLKMITKAGAFGKEDAIFYSINKLKESKFFL